MIFSAHKSFKGKKDISKERRGGVGGGLNDMKKYQLSIVGQNGGEIILWMSDGFVRRSVGCSLRFLRAGEQDKNHIWHIWHIWLGLFCVRQKSSSDFVLATRVLNKINSYCIHICR